MPQIPEKIVPVLRAQLRKVTMAAEKEPVKVERMLQDVAAGVMQKVVSVSVTEEIVHFPGFDAAMISPENADTCGAVMYVHGGGYCCGDLEYAKWFGKILADEARVQVLCPAYRLAPEHPFPAALDDTELCYRHLRETYPAEKIVLAGESAGGGLIFCLCERLKQEGRELPAGLVAISPWTDLTQSGASYAENEAVDPSMTRARLDKFSVSYTADPLDPLCSPLFGDAEGMPESLLFVGGDEVMRDDAVRMHRKLLAAGCRSQLTVAEGMWHAYVFYGLKERSGDMAAIRDFVRSKVI